MKLITLYLPELWIQKLDDLVAAKLYPNRAEAIRFSVRDLLKQEHPLTDLRLVKVSPPGLGMSYQAMEPVQAFEPNTPGKQVKKPEC